MPSGHADWRPPGAGAGGRLLAFSDLPANPTDIIPAPGAGFRIALFDLFAVSGSATALDFIREYTPANVIVRVLFHVGSTAGTPYAMPYNGLPLGAGNKVRMDTPGAGAWRVHITYAVEAI